MWIEIQDNIELYESYDYIVDYLYELYEKLSKEERDKLDRDCFGIPDTRSYPMPDKQHVLYAIRMFNFCKPSKEALLAKNIINFIEHFKMDIRSIKVGDNNRFSKYWKSYIKKKVK